MLERGQVVLVDTNAILEAHRVGCWAQLVSHFAFHTVEKVVEETQNGYQNRSPEQTIDETTLRSQLSHVECIDELQRATFLLEHPAAIMDPGERDLVIYAGKLKMADVWLLNGPDVATVRHAHSRSWLDRLVSLEEMNNHLKLRLSKQLLDNHTSQWLSNCRRDFIMGIRK